MSFDFLHFFLSLPITVYVPVRDAAADSYRYHYLNHYTIFGAGYKASAMSIMKSLISKYGSQD